MVVGVRIGVLHLGGDVIVDSEKYSAKTVGVGVCKSYMF